MGGEDFANYLSVAPGALLRLGSSGKGHDLHSPGFVLDEATVGFGVRAGLGAVIGMAEGSDQGGGRRGWYHRTRDDRPRGTQENTPYEPHIGESRQYWRDIILGVNDGLVSIFLLVVGVVGGGLDTDQVLSPLSPGLGRRGLDGGRRVSGHEVPGSGARGGASAGEVHIRDHRQQELDQLTEMFGDMGLRQEDVDMVVAAFDRSDDAILNAMKALEFGFVESERRSPIARCSPPASCSWWALSRRDSVLRLRLHQRGPGVGHRPGADRLFLVGVVKARGGPAQLADVGFGEHGHCRDRRRDRMADRECGRHRPGLSPLPLANACNS